MEDTNKSQLKKALNGDGIKWPEFPTMNPVSGTSIAEDWLHYVSYIVILLIIFLLFG